MFSIHWGWLLSESRFPDLLERLAVKVSSGIVGVEFCALWKGTHWCKGETGKAEDAKLPDAGISLKQCPEK